MEKKNTILLTVIAIATLLVAVVGATFAYFSSNQTVLSENINADLTASTSSAKFMAATDGTDLNVTVLPSDISETSDEDKNITKMGNITVNLTGVTGATTTCNYEIKWKWAEDATYLKAVNVGNELTVEVTKKTTSGDGSNIDATYNNNYIETQLPNALNGNELTLVNGQIVSSSDTPVETTWQVTYRFYSNTLEQEKLITQKIVGNVYVKAGNCLES